LARLRQAGGENGAAPGANVFRGRARLKRAFDFCQVWPLREEYGATVNARLKGRGLELLTTAPRRAGEAGMSKPGAPLRVLLTSWPALAVGCVVLWMLGVWLLSLAAGI
jgi:hypothetical protein